jgi:AraC-like DNA-binding protein
MSGSGTPRRFAAVPNFGSDRGEADMPRPPAGFRSVAYDRKRTSAAHQLRNSDKPLARIAAQVGYESEAAFNRAFKRSSGVTPAAWRRNVLES